jgi:ABC-type branched-subunit amino acid transport system ATPase component
VADRLELAGICFSFGGLQVASDITLGISPGARMALIGPNGAGKTTLVNLISGALQPSAGDIRLNGKSIVGMSEAARARAGIVRTFQVGRLFRDLSVADNLRLPLVQRRGEARRLWPSRTREAEVDREAGALLDAFGLADRSDRITGTLAYGEQRLVEIAIALALRPTVLLLDEPAAGVPQGESGVILDVIAALPSDLSVLLIEHDMDVVFRFAHRIVVMAGGAMLADGTPADVAADEHVKQIYFGRQEHGHARPRA